MDGRQWPEGPDDGMLNAKMSRSDSAFFLLLEVTFRCPKEGKQVAAFGCISSGLLFSATKFHAAPAKELVGLVAEETDVPWTHRNLPSFSKGCKNDTKGIGMT